MRSKWRAASAACSIEFYQWLVLPAIVFLLGSIVAATRWRGVRAPLLAAAVGLTPAGAQADAVSAARDALARHQYPAARDAYQQLADSTRSSGRTARFRLGEGTAAYRAGDFQHARAAFSGALQSGDPQVLANGHTGLGNTLFQLGWQSLAGQSYPGDPAHLPDLPQFDTLVHERLAKLRESAEPAPDDAGGYAALDSLITNWADAVRHFDSACATDPPAAAAAAHNRKIPLIYLKRLAELLERDQQQTEQALPQPQPGEGSPQPGEGDAKDKPGDKDGDDKGPKPPGDKGKSNEDPQKGSDNEPEKPADKSADKKDDQDPEKGPGDPNETPVEKARRILKENADLEKGPLTPGRREFQAPKQDW